MDGQVNNNQNEKVISISDLYILDTHLALASHLPLTQKDDKSKQFFREKRERETHKMH